MDDPEPELILVRTPCPLCGAATAKEADVKCAPRVSCPASDMTDADGYIVEATAASAQAWHEWDQRQE
jgi:hypothetical protein